MGMDLEREVFSCEPEYFEAGVDIGITTETKTASADIEAHVPVILSGDTVAAVTSADLADLSGLYGITADSASADGDCVVYLTGEFFVDDLVLEDGVTADDLEVAFRNIGIFLK